MSFRDILCPIFSLGADEPVLSAGEVVAEMGAAQLTALLLEVEPDSAFTDRDASADALARAEFKVEKTELAARRGPGPRQFEVRDLAVTAAGAGAAVGALARFADLTIILRPGDALQEDLRTALFEGVLFGSGRPVLLIPPNWSRSAIGRNVVVGWSDKREAARALADAAPFLERAEHITILCVAVGEGRSKSMASGEAVVSHLLRRGRRAELRHAGEFGFSDGATLMAQAGGVEADLIVMGGYGQPRLREFVFGGATREVMKAARMPVLMAH